MKASLPFKYIIADKKGKNYVVFDFKDDSGKRKRKWVTTDLPADCSYKALTAKVNVIVAKFYEEFLTGSLTKVKEAPKEKEKDNKDKKNESKPLTTPDEARKLQIGTPLIDNAENMKPLSIAVEELYEGKVKIVSNGDDSEIM